MNFQYFVQCLDTPDHLEHSNREKLIEPGLYYVVGLQFGRYRRTQFQSVLLSEAIPNTDSKARPQTKSFCIYEDVMTAEAILSLRGESVALMTFNV
ncbi:hypothetical protein CDAR_480161 [Caerostris darwini]|uniref:Uncharacterized protein n=1 Tax=Caerostris darwini TaxID=1538125 RepID=A0AAV4V0L6_9ARAC|nr:hypothetical protein CDAR_480161 [Caerostris darwini]